MNADEFLELFIKELKLNKDLTHYHRLVNSEDLYAFRKAYVHQRMKFVLQQVTGPPKKIWDVGCGYATTSILLALNGFDVLGTTLEYYYDKIRKRLEYWSKYGNVDSLEIKYENVFDRKEKDESFDIILAQDTLHHLEPVHDALDIFSNTLKKEGKLVVSEENGNNLFNRAKNFKQRGFKRVIKIYDDKLQRNILFGNENTRSLNKWTKLLYNHGFEPGFHEYIRLFPPSRFKKCNYDDVIAQEQKIWTKYAILREFFYFGINFTAKRNK